MMSNRVLFLFAWIGAITVGLLIAPQPISVKASAASNLPGSANADIQAGIHELDIASVWSGSPVGLALLTHGTQQYVAYYAANRQLIVAQRTLGEKTWRFTPLPTTVGWDSHNYVTMALDRDGYLHVAGNMHAVPLIYFKSTRPGDASSLVKVDAMTGKNESRVTYPHFFYDPKGALHFEYRMGRSGAGDTYIDRYDEKSKSWSAVINEPLFQGGNERNAYPIAPVFGPDGWYHLVWVWRESPMCETNHLLSYVRSRDLVHWETIAGKPVTLPITTQTPGVAIDPAPVHAGLINGSQSIGFDASGNLVIAYTKYDAEGNTQLYFARWEDGQWRSQQATNWKYRWNFYGGGSIPMEVMMGPLKFADGRLTIMIHHAVYGTGVWQVDPSTMRIIGDRMPLPGNGRIAAQFAPPSGSPLVQQFENDLGGANYRLTWNTLEPNRDRPRSEGAPAATMLRLLVNP